MANKFYFPEQRAFKHHGTFAFLSEYFLVRRNEGSLNIVLGLKRNFLRKVLSIEHLGGRSGLEPSSYVYFSIFFGRFHFYSKIIPFLVRNSKPKEDGLDSFRGLLSLSSTKRRRVCFKGNYILFYLHSLKYLSTASLTSSVLHLPVFFEISAKRCQSDLAR